MGKIEDLAKKLEDNRKKKEQNSILRETQKAEWIASLASLFGQIKDWISPLVSKNLVVIRQFDLDLAEDFIGQYKAPALQIEGQDWTITFKPVGRYIIGALGRVDIFCGPRILMLVLHKDGWKLAEKKDRAFEYHSFDRDLLAEVIEALTS